MSSTQVVPGVLYAKTNIVGGQSCDIVHDTLMRSNRSTEQQFAFFYYKNGNLSHLGLNQIAIYEKDGGSPTITHTGFIFCDDYFVNSRNGWIYDSNGAEITEYPCWCPQLTEQGEVLFIKLDDNGIYKYTPPSGSNPATTVRVGSVVLKHNWIHYWGNSEIIIWDEWTDLGTPKKGLRRISLNGEVLGSLKEGVEEVQSFQRFGADELLYLDSEFMLHKISFPAGNELSSIPDVMQFYVYKGQLYYLGLDDKLYKETV